MKQRVGNYLCILIWLVQGVVEGLTAWAVWRLNMLPNRYFIILAVALIVVWSMVGVILLLGSGKQKGAYARKKKGPSLARRILGCALAIVMTVVCGFAWSVLSDVRSTIHGVTNNPERVNVSMSVYIRADDPAQELADAADYSFGCLENFDESRTNRAIDAINQELGSDIQVTYFKTLGELVDGLYNGDCDAFILNPAYVTVMEENETFADLAQRTRILYTANLEETVEPPAQSNEQGNGQNETQAGNQSGNQSGNQQLPSKQEGGITANPFIVYVSGSDTRSYYLSNSRSDVNILVVVNPVTKQVLLVNTPRDYYVPNPAGYGAKDKLTHCGIYGTSCSMEALANLYDTTVPYYAQINFTGVETLIDAIDGIDVNSDVGFYALNQYWIDEGMNHLDGEEALAFARDRYNVPGGDNGRGKHQMMVIEALIQKATSGTTIISNYADILKSIEGMFTTNLSADEIGELVKMQLDDMASWNIQSYAVNGNGGSDVTYSMPGVYCYVMYPDQTLVDYGAELIQRVMDGETLTAEDMTCPGY